jgi:hypothetical protein
LCHLQHKLIGFYNRDGKCLQRGTDWVFKGLMSVDIPNLVKIDKNEDRNSVNICQSDK